jgi:regulator of cell morphogenesis and NO signaling
MTVPSTRPFRFHAQQEVSSVVAAAPRTSRVFERLGIDYCCGGKTPLEKACAAKGLDPQRVLSELEAAVAAPSSERDWTNESASALVEHVLSTHHVFVKRELPRLVALMDKVNRVHGLTHLDSIPEMARIWTRLAFEVEQHLTKEEEILFPMILALDQGRASSGHCGGVGVPIRVMEWEHEEHGKAFARLRVLANDYVPPPDACGSWRALWSGLDEFEKDLHMHVHLENNVLFPKARALAGDCVD